MPDTDPNAILEGLNPQQREAAEYPGAALLVVAGAGSGKTRVLTRRIAWLIATGRAWPSQILAITFTNKAAAEMRERVHGLLGEAARGMWVSTFHSACLRILRAEAKAVGMNSSFTIYDTQDSRALMKRILKEQRGDVYGLTPAGALHHVSAAKNELRTPDDAGAREGDPTARALREAWRAYEQAKHRANAFDFDDLLCETVFLFRAHPEIAARYRDRFRHVLVDEYQDTNHAQYELVRLLSGGESRGEDSASDAAAERLRTLTVVGDSDQSIYAFRGADVRNITGFEHDFPEARTILLEQNYRSTQNVLTAANAVISHNLERTEKNLWTDTGAGPKLVGFTGYSAHDEAQFVTDEIVRLRDDEGVDYRDMAVFYRTNAQTRALEEILVRGGIPYRVVGGTKFYERAEVKDVLAYLVAVVNPADELSVRRILNVPKRGIGQVTAQRIATWAAEHDQTLVEALSHGADCGVGPRLAGRMAELGEALRDTREALAGGRGLETAVTQLLDRSGYLPALQNSPDPQVQARAENVDELVSQVADFAAGNPEAGLGDFLAEVSLTSAADDLDDAAGAVSLMTLHTAKGLEFDTVFITGLEEGLLPHQMSFDEPGGMSEERRLFYVGITRAKRHLALSLSVMRTLYGQSKSQMPSRFLDDIPAEVLEWRRSPEEATRGGSAELENSGWGRSRGEVGRPGRAGWASPVVVRHREAPRADAVPPIPDRRSEVTWSNLVTPGAARNTLALQAGDRVRHRRFGEGVVARLTGSGARQIAVVDFDDAGRKQLVVALAPLAKVATKHESDDPTRHISET